MSNREMCNEMIFVLNLHTQQPPFMAIYMRVKMQRIANDFKCHSTLEVENCINVKLTGTRNQNHTISMHHCIEVVITLQ